MSSECIFCGIIAGEIPAKILHQNPAAIAFADTNPQAPTHILIVPRQHSTDIMDLVARSPQGLIAMTQLAADVAQRQVAGQFRLVYNTGADAGQSVFHTHAHLLGGRPLKWPPG